MPVAEARLILRVVPRGVDELKGAWLLRAARLFGLTPSQAKKIEYGEVKDMRASRLDSMRAKLSELQERALKRGEMLDALDQRRNELGAGSRDPSGSSPRASQAGGRST